MERRTIGAPSLQVGAVGLGCMPMHWAYTASARRREGSLEAIHAALDLGMNLLDTADMFGPFTNELLMGRVLRERRADAFVSTKCGLLVGDQHIVANGHPGYVRRACDASLRRLRTDVIDLYQLHRPDPEVPVEETWGAMADLVRAGKVRSLGFCAVGAYAGRRPSPIRAGRLVTGAERYRTTVSQLERVQQVFPISAVTAELSVWTPQARETLLPWCAARGVGFLAAQPLGSGFLTGTLKPGQGFEPEDVRARHPRFTAEAMAGNQVLVAELRRVARRHGPEVSAAQVALAWVLAQGSQVVAVPGTKHARWVAENARAASLQLTAADLAGIAALPAAREAW
ncbi:aldo/keto reductase [Streptomyces sp. NPDC006879]|uniref:aldo/keto reductase n=1 Tax=Streptomyces sp. NPDC006879 TaxID=3364767 RepID=UPI0036CB0431